MKVKSNGVYANEIFIIEPNSLCVLNKIKGDLIKGMFDFSF